AIKGSELRDLSDQIRQSKKAAAVLLGSVDDGRVYLVVNVDPSLVDAGVDAVAIAREAAKKIEGGGGGRPNLAEAGGKNPAGLDEAFGGGKRRIAAARGGRWSGSAKARARPGTPSGTRPAPLE